MDTTPPRQLEVLWGAALANENSRAYRFEAPVSSWAIEINGLPAWPIVRPRLDRVSPYHVTIETIFGRATLCGAVFGLPKRNKICLNLQWLLFLHDAPQRKFFRAYRYVSGST